MQNISGGDSVVLGSKGTAGLIQTCFVLHVQEIGMKTC